MIFNYLLGKIQKNLFKFKMLKNVSKHKTTKLCGGVEMNNVCIGAYSYVGFETKINNCTIGKYCSIAGGVVIGGGAHPISWVSTSPIFSSRHSIFGKGICKKEFDPFKQTKIGNDVWIGSNSIIKAGVEIGDGAILGMGSVLTHDIPPYEIWAGNPARKIRNRFDDETIKAFLDLKWWDFDVAQIKELASYISDCNLFIKEAYKLKGSFKE